MITVLLIVLCILALYQPSWDRFTIATVYAVMCLGQAMLCDNFTGIWYYLSASVFDLAILSIICAYGAHIRLTDDLINICAVSIVLNFYGWLTYFAYQPPYSYNMAMTALYFIAILSLLRKECASERRTNKWHNSIRLFVYKSVASYRSIQKES